MWPMGVGGWRTCRDGAWGLHGSLRGALSERACWKLCAMNESQSVQDLPFQIATLESRSRPRQIAFALLLCIGAWYYYALIDGAFRRPYTAAFAAPSFLASEVTRPIGASWRAVSAKSSDNTAPRLAVSADRVERQIGSADARNRRDASEHETPCSLAAAQGFTCLTPDGRGHGESGGKLVTAGLLEGQCR